jgi:glycosyltransferase involved in cell wall biosynthesis
LEYLRFKPDILIVSGLIGFFPILFKKLKLIKKPIIYYWGDYFHEVMGKKWGPSKCAFMEFFCAKNASFVTTPSKYLYYKSKILGIKCKYIPHGIIDDLHKIKKNPLRELSSKQKNLLKFIYIGDIDEYKRVDKIINAAGGKNCILYLIGRTFNKGLIKNLAKNIVYLGELPQKETLSYVKACDFAVITADQDSALKMFEFIAMQKPILAFNGRINYVLTHRENAYLTNDFPKAISDILIGNKELPEKLSEGVKKFKIKNWKEIVKEYNEIIIPFVKN